MQSVHWKLSRWGDYEMAAADYSGWSRENIVHHIGCGGRAVPQDRILMREIPKFLAPVRAAVLSLPEIYREALILKYCIPPKSDGQIHKDAEMAQKLDISKDAYIKRVKRARRKVKLRLNHT